MGSQSVTIYVCAGAQLSGGDWVAERRNSARELIARQLQSIQISEHGYGDRFGLEEFVGQLG